MLVWHLHVYAKHLLFLKDFFLLFLGTLLWKSYFSTSTFLISCRFPLSKQIINALCHTVNVFSSYFSLHSGFFLSFHYSKSRRWQLETTITERRTFNERHSRRGTETRRVVTQRRKTNENRKYFMVSAMCVLDLFCFFWISVNSLTPSFFLIPVFFNFQIFLFF